jgi:predicted metal-dependent phosphoesterase TrpH
VLSLHLKLDLHVHTVSSKGDLVDSAETVEKILDIAKEKGLDGLFLTDYSSLDSYWKARSFDSGLLILPGFARARNA